MTNDLKLLGVYQVTLTVSDLDRSKDFYEGELGMPMAARFDAAGLMFFYAGDLRLALQQVEKVEAVSSVIYFRVDDIEAAVENLKSHSVKVERDAELVFPDEQGQFGEAGEEEWMAFFRDPDDHLLALVSRFKPEG